LYQREMIAQNLRSDTAARFQRTERIVEYWREPSQALARAAFQATLEDLLWNHG
jgi:hypothetical protein